MVPDVNPDVLLTAGATGLKRVVRQTIHWCYWHITMLWSKHFKLGWYWLIWVLLGWRAWSERPLKRKRPRLRTFDFLVGCFVLVHLFCWWEIKTDSNMARKGNECSLILSHVERDMRLCCVSTRRRRWGIGCKGATEVASVCFYYVIIYTEAWMKKFSKAITLCFACTIKET